jgi:nitroreductase
MEAQMITVIDAIRNRRSIRKYKPDPVPDDIILQLLDCARLAPSSHNCQVSRFVVIKDADFKKKLREYAYRLPFVESAPCIIICCADLTVFAEKTDRRRVRELEAIGATEDIGKVGELVARLQAVGGGGDDIFRFSTTAELNTFIAIEHIVLAAMAFGLGTCWIRLIEAEKIHSLLNLPDTTIVVALLSLGFPDQDPPQRPRLPLENFIITPIPEACSLKTSRPSNP